MSFKYSFLPFQTIQILCQILNLAPTSTMYVKQYKISMHSFKNKSSWIATIIQCEFLMLEIVRPFQTLLLGIEICKHFQKDYVHGTKYLVCFVKMLGRLYFVWEYCSWNRSIFMIFIL